MNKRIMDDVDYNLSWLHWKPLHFSNVKTLCFHD
jgi:hypothetical protein